MSDSRRLVIGSEIQTHETQKFCTGIQRVIRETHQVLHDELSMHNASLVPLHTRDWPRREEIHEIPYLASDPVVLGRSHRADACDVMLFLDLNPQIDFPELFRVRKQRGIPTIFLIYDILPITHPEWFPEGASRIFRVYLQQVLRVADHIVVTSEHVRHDLLSLGWVTEAQVHVIGLGSTFTQQGPTAILGSELSLLYVSTLAPRKGHELLLDTFDELRVRGRDVSLTLVGQPGWECNELLDRLRNHTDLDGRLKWFHSGDDHLIRCLAQSSNIGVVPAEDEGFGLFLEEASALGLHVVARDIPVFAERPQLNLVLAVGSPERFADAIEEIALRSPEDLRGRPTRHITQFGHELSSLVLEVMAGISR